MLGPGERESGKSFAGHEWRARSEDGKLVHSYMVQPTPAAQTVRLGVCADRGDGTGGAWEWEDYGKGSGVWRRYDAQTSAAIGAALAAGQPQYQLITMSGKSHNE